MLCISKEIIDFGRYFDFNYFLMNLMKDKKDAKRYMFIFF